MQVTQRILFLSVILPLAASLCVFAQTGAAAVRDYVGLINQSYDPGIVSFLDTARAEFRRRGELNLANTVERIIAGAFGSGFLYSDADGNFFVITNAHVIAHAHTVSITFERLGGEMRRIDNLKIIAVDEEADLAILAVPAGEILPVSQGLEFLDRAIEEGEGVFSAGFPGLGGTPLWQFASGNVSNAFARFPRSHEDPTLIGPFIQHTAQIDAGNSGGPLLVAQSGVPSGFAVVGINSLAATRRQAANFAIPPGTVKSFIDRALNPDPETFRVELDRRLSEFVGGLGVNRAVYPHIAQFLSNANVGENIEFAFEEMFDRAGMRVRRTFLEKANENFIAAMSIPVAWTIEDNLRTGGGALRASLTEVTGSGKEYTVVFTINNVDVSSVWIREYGNWRIRSFETIAAGDRTLIVRRQRERQARERLRTASYRFFVEAGYANLFDKAPAALYASFGISWVGGQVYYTGPDFWTAGVFFGFQRDFTVGSFGIMPHLRFGMNFQHDQSFDDWADAENAERRATPGDSRLPVENIPFFFMAQAGLRITSSYVPGLFLGLNFQYNFANLHTAITTGWNNPMRMAFAVSLGYIF